MPVPDTSQEGVPNTTRNEHISDAEAKRVVLRGLDPTTGLYKNVGLTDNGDGTYSIKTSAAAGSGGLTDAQLRATPVPVSGTVTANLPAGTNNIGDVDVLTLPSLIAGTALIGDTGQYATTTTQADGQSNASLRVPSNAAGQALNQVCYNRVFNGTTWDRMKGDSTDGTLVNLGTNNDVTVTSGTVAITSADLTSLLLEMQVNNGGMAQQVDDTGTTLYQGWAAPGSATSGALWRIRRVVSSGTPTDTAITFADGNRNFDNIWDNRAALSYS